MIMNDLIRERVEIREQFDELQKDVRRDFWFFSLTVEFVEAYNMISKISWKKGM